MKPDKTRHAGYQYVGHVSLSLGDRLLVQPGLKHQHAPQVILPIAPAREVLRPFLPNGPRREKSVLFEASLAKQIIRPVAKRPAKPRIDRHPEAHFGTLDQ